MGRFEAIKVHGLNFSYDKMPILKEVSFTVRPGELIYLIGPNGGGKTTLLKLLMGFLQPSSGFVQIFGQSPADVPEKIAYVPQNFSYDRLFPISVFDVVLSGRLAYLPWHGFYRKNDKELCLEAIKQVGLLDYKDQPIGELSGGQLQRILIARALASHPQILILDEPTSCLDHQAQKEVENLIKNLKGKMTILMVTHDLDHIGTECDRIFCIHGTFSQLSPDKVCQHVAMGLYPTPSKNLKEANV